MSLLSEFLSAQQLSPRAFARFGFPRIVRLPSADTSASCDAMNIRCLSSRRCHTQLFRPCVMSRCTAGSALSERALEALARASSSHCADTGAEAITLKAVGVRRSAGLVETA